MRKVFLLMGLICAIQSMAVEYAFQATSIASKEQNTDGNWREWSEWNELLTLCTWVFTTLNGVSDYQVTDKNGNSIFLPAGGYCDGTGSFNVGNYGYYWSSFVNADAAYDALSILLSNGVCRNPRYRGLSVRPVCK